MVILLVILSGYCTRTISSAGSVKITNCTCIKKANRPVLFKNTIIIYCENHKHATSEKSRISELYPSSNKNLNVIKFLRLNIHPIKPNVLILRLLFAEFQNVNICLH
jgi:hypothetical protein